VTSGFEPHRLACARLLCRLSYGHYETLVWETGAVPYRQHDHKADIARRRRRSYGMTCSWTELLPCRRREN
jgi:hypothetical protein